MVFSRWVRRLLAAAMLPGVLLGCSQQPTVIEPAPQIPPARVEPRRTVIGESREGRPIECEPFGDRGEAVLLLGAIHGSEPGGARLLRGLAGHLAAHPELIQERRVLLVPVANPDGLARGRRFNAHGVDVNRNFAAPAAPSPGRPAAAAFSEPESRAIRDIIAGFAPARIVSFHQPLHCIDHDGPPQARLLAEAMARQSGLPLRKLGTRPGSLGAYAGESLGIPVVTVELPRMVDGWSDERLWSQYGPMLLVAIRFPATPELAK